MYSEIQKCFKRCKHLRYVIFKLKNSILLELKKLTYCRIPFPVVVLSENAYLF